MRRGGRIAAIVGGAAAAGAVVAVGLLGFVGVERTVPAGTETRICGSTIGVSMVDPGRVRLLGASDAALEAGDRARIHAFCVVEVLGVEGAGSSGGDDGSEAADGSQATVQLRWRLW